MKRITISISIEVETEWDALLVERNAERLAENFARDRIYGFDRLS